jgi:hypothetical protein
MRERRQVRRNRTGRMPCADYLRVKQPPRPVRVSENESANVSVLGAAKNCMRRAKDM